MKSVRVLFLILGISAVLFGQADTGVLTGEVRDPSGAVVPGAEVKITVFVYRPRQPMESGALKILLDKRSRFGYRKVDEWFGA